MSRRTRPLARLALAAVPVVLILAGCSSGGDASSAGSGGSSADRGLADSVSVQDTAAKRVAAPEEQDRLFISTGTVSLRARDVAGARAGVVRVVDRYRGEVAEQQSESDAHGRLEHARLVVRIPSAHFAEAVEALEGTAQRISSETHAEEVTTQVIDTRVALRVQRRSVARVETLLDRATSIRDVVAIETQLSRRQARLGQLEQRAAYLADQTSMSTVAVSIERTRSHRAGTEDGAGGFLSGLRAGWDGLGAVTLVLATTVGALLPFALVLSVLLGLAWPVVRRLRLRRPTPRVE
jgi:hypothetical protein